MSRKILTKKCPKCGTEVYFIEMDTGYSGKICSGCNNLIELCIFKKQKEPELGFA